MDWTLIVLLVVGVPIGLAAWLIARAISARHRIDELARRVETLESELHRLRRAPAPPAEDPVESTTPISAPPIIPAFKPKPEPVSFSTASAIAPSPEPMAASAPFRAQIQAPEPPRLSEPAMAPFPAIDWEQFMGVKLFAWVGGLALFLGVSFFVKYSFDNNLVPPELRVAMGFLTGLGLLVGGVVMAGKQRSTLSQTLCATGVVILYAVTFACRSIYHFEFFGPVPTFFLMALITATAFLLAVRLDAMVVALLGMLGGFLTPVLLSTGVDNPVGLFGYIAILDAGLLVVALHRRWDFLAGLAAGGTVLTQLAWADKFFTPGHYFEGARTLIALGVLLGFILLYLGGCWWARSRQRSNPWFWGSTLGLAAVAFAFAAWFLSFPTMADRPWLVFSFVFFIDMAVAALVLLEPDIAIAHPLAGFAVFGLLALWTSDSLRGESLNAGLVFYFVLAVAHSVFPAIVRRILRPGAPPWHGQVFPPLALVLVLMPILKLAELSFLVWPFVLLVDLLAIGLGVLTASLLPIVVVLLLTLAAAGALIFKIPETLTGLPASLFLLGAFSIFFVGAGLWLARKFAPGSFKGRVESPGNSSLPQSLAVQIPSLSAVLPFSLLMMATSRLPLHDPSPVFGLALLLTLLLLGIAWLFMLEWMPAIGLACVSALECTWHFQRFSPADPTPALAWYLVFLAVFAAFPFLFRRRFESQVVPWAAAAMIGPPQFLLLHRLVAAAYPNHVMGLLPAAFSILPLASLVVVLKQTPPSNPARTTQLAWFGGVALFFITLIFPIQFERQWITLGWALEGTALLWLFRRLPHPGLRLVGASLLLIAFVRLALNPAVLEYHARSATPIFNWYLYAYGIVTVCLFAGARLVAAPRHQVLGLNAPPLLAGAGTVLAFLLLNIQIADYFSEPGSTLTFQFSGNFARDMTYSIAWALFALVLLVLGIVRKTPGSRYAALALLSVTVLKLFFHDLASLGQLYRIGAFIGVAIIAMVASFAYQRFFASAARDSAHASAP